MIIIAIAILTLMTVANLRYWRLVEARRLRWKLYELRDELRWEAIEDRRLVDSRLFWTLDQTLTRDCTHLESLSVWHILGMRHFMRDSKAEYEEWRRQFDRELHRPENARIAKIYHRSVLVYLQYLCTRHVILFVLSIVTVVGPILLYGAFKRLAEQLTTPRDDDHRHPSPA